MERYILAAVIGSLVGYIIMSYNSAVKLRNYVKEAFSTMDVYLKKRWDLVPNLVECVSAYAKHEKSVFEGVTNLRARNYENMSLEEKINVNNTISESLPKIVAISENYPELKANTNFSELMTNLSSIEEDIANSRKYYNGTVRELNNFLEIFPTNIIAKVFGFKPEKMFEITSDQRENVKVDF